MCCDVVQVRPLEHLKLAVRFADGVEGIVELQPSHLHGVFEPLKIPAVFAQVQCSDGFVSWPGDIDLAPDSMYAAISKAGKWVLI